jgi:hypothetical protein
MPGTELAFQKNIRWGIFGGRRMERETAVFRQINREESRTHHDALEFPDGKIVLLTRLCSGQEATVLQLPAQATQAPKGTERITTASALSSISSATSRGESASDG